MFSTRALPRDAPRRRSRRRDADLPPPPSISFCRHAITPRAMPAADASPSFMSFIAFRWFFADCCDIIACHDAISFFHYGVFFHFHAAVSIAFRRSHFASQPRSQWPSGILIGRRSAARRASGAHKRVFIDSARQPAAADAPQSAAAVKDSAARARKASVMCRQREMGATTPPASALPPQMLQQRRQELQAICRRRC